MAVKDFVEARIKELEHMRVHRVFEVVNLSDVRHVKKVKAKCLQDWKGDIIKARLVAMEIAYDARDDVHAGTPPLAAIRLIIISLAASRTGLNGAAALRKVCQFDIMAALIHAFIKAWMVIIPPKEIVEPGEGLWLLKAFYGTREASRPWQDHYSKILYIFAATFYNALYDMALACQEDYFICKGTDSGIDALESRRPRTTTSRPSPRGASDPEATRRASS